MKLPQPGGCPICFMPLVEKMKGAWVKTSKRTFEQRMVEAGMENKWEAEILSGLSEGDAVVSSGAYLISKYIIKKGFPLPARNASAVLCVKAHASAWNIIVRLRVRAFVFPGAFFL